MEEPTAMSSGAGARGNDFLRDYVDDVVVRLEVIADPLARPTEAWEIHLPGSSVPRQDVFIAELQSLIEGPEAELRGRPYQLDIKRNVTSWGADAVVEQIVLQLAEWGAQGVAGAATWAALQGAARRFAALVGVEPGLSAAAPLAREEALVRAEWVVRERFGLPEASTGLDGGTEPVDDSLRLTGEAHHASGEFEFSWVRDGVIYEAGVSQDDRYVIVLWMRRRSP